MVKVQQRQQRGLGRGLSALIGEADAPIREANKTAPARVGQGDSKPVEGLLHVPLSSMVANRYQPRQHFDAEKLQDLANSIKSNGIMQPIVVRSSVDFAGKFEIIAGERRFRASEMAGLKEVPVLLRELDDTQALELAIVENIQRHDLNAIEEAQGYQRLMEEFAYTQEKLAKSVGKSRSHVANLMRLLALPEAVKQHLAKDELSMGHARALLGAEEPEQLAAEIIQQGLSVRQAEAMVKKEKQGDAQPKKPRELSQKGGMQGRRFESNQPKDDDILSLETMLTENLGLKVDINDLGGQQGQIVITYETLAQLDGVLQRLDGK